MKAENGRVSEILCRNAPYHRLWVAFFSPFLPLTLTILFPDSLLAQDIAQVKKGVVKITAQADGKNRIGSGIIVKLEEDHAYIVTASHVIEGDQQPNVFFFSAPHRPFRARVLGLEGGNPAGLAALLVEGRLPSDLEALNLDQATSVSGGEPIMLIGFPRVEGSLWTVTTGTLSGRRGSALSFAGVADEGNSGGPVIFQGKVVGIVTEVGAKFNSAAPAVVARFALDGWGVRLPEEASRPPIDTAPEEAEQVATPRRCDRSSPGNTRAWASPFWAAWSAYRRSISKPVKRSAARMPITKAISASCKAVCTTIYSRGAPAHKRFKGSSATSSPN